MNGLIRFCAVISIVTLCACASLSEKQSLKKFGETIEALGRALKQGDYMVANQIAGGAAGDIDSEKLKNVKIVEITTTHIQVSDDKRDVARDVEFEYFLLDKNIVRSLKFKELWHYNQESKRWLLKNGLPTFE